MKTEVKQRLVGFGVLLAVALVSVPFIISANKHVIPETRLSETVPLPPEQPKMHLAMVKPRQSIQPAQQIQPLKTEAPILERMVPPAAKVKIVTAQPVHMHPATTKSKKVVHRVQTAWVVRLATLSHKRNVNKLVKKLRAKGLRAYTRKFRTKKGWLTSVYVGPELERSKAKILLDKLQTSFHMKGIIVKYRV